VKPPPRGGFTRVVYQEDQTDELREATESSRER